MDDRVERRVQRIDGDARRGEQFARMHGTVTHELGLGGRIQSAEFFGSHGRIIHAARDAAQGGIG
jgi:hypothetical protein